MTMEGEMTQKWTRILRVRMQFGAKDTVGAVGQQVRLRGSHHAE
jgi:hypothetical protein